MEAGTRRMVFEAEGIICSGCAMDMETVLRGKFGVVDVAVSYSDGTIAVEYDPEDIFEEEILDQIKRFGFKTKRVE